MQGAGVALAVGVVVVVGNVVVAVGVGVGAFACRFGACPNLYGDVCRSALSFRTAPVFGSAKDESLCTSAAPKSSCDVVVGGTVGITIDEISGGTEMSKDTGIVAMGCMTCVWLSMSSSASMTFANG